jgi:hypothetical protein
MKRMRITIATLFALAALSGTAWSQTVPVETTIWDTPGLSQDLLFEKGGCFFDRHPDFTPGDAAPDGAWRQAVGRLRTNWYNADNYIQYTVVLEAQPQRFTLTFSDPRLIYDHMPYERTLTAHEYHAVRGRLVGLDQKMYRFFYDNRYAKPGACLIR